MPACGIVNSIFHQRLLIFASLALTLMSVAELAGKPPCQQSPIKIDRIEASEHYILGTKMRVAYKLTCIADFFHLGMDHRRLPKGVDVDLVHNGNQRPVKKNDLPIPGIGAYDFKQAVSLREGDCVELSFDISDCFEELEPGRYNLAFKFAGDELAKVNITISELSQSRSWECFGEYLEEIHNGISREGSFAIGCKTEIGIAQAGGDSLGWYLLSSTVIGADSSAKDAHHGDAQPVATRIKLPAKATVLAQAVDFRRRLWILVGSESEQALFVWDVGREEIRQVLEWGGRIEFSITPESTVSRGVFVVAGRKGTPRLTSSHRQFGADQDR